MESGCDSGEVHTRHDCELLLLLLVVLVGRGRGQWAMEQSQCPRSLLVLHQQSCAPYQIVTHLPYRTDINSVPEYLNTDHDAIVNRTLYIYLYTPYIYGSVHNHHSKQMLYTYTYIYICMQCTNPEYPTNKTHIPIYICVCVCLIVYSGPQT